MQHYACELFERLNHIPNRFTYCFLLKAQLFATCCPCGYRFQIVERSGSGVELRTLDYENPGSNPGCGVKTMGKFSHSTFVDMCTSSLRTLIVAYGWMLHREAELMSE